MIDYKQVGLRIASLRKKAGLSQAILATKLGVTAQAVSKWENGHNIPDIEIFRELAWILNTTIDSLLDGNLPPGLRRVTPLLRCPACGSSLELHAAAAGEPYFTCTSGHHYGVVDGVIDFGSREIPGELWSQYMRSYDSYLREQNHPGNPRYQMGDIPCSEVRWQEIKNRRPRVILDIACGTCNGLKYDLQRINWPCLVIMTDLSHRILKYNLKYFTEDMPNPYVTLVGMACDCSNIPIIDDCIDAVVSNGGFESMQNKMMDGFREGYRILKPGSNAIYNMSLVDDFNSPNTLKWLQLFRTLSDTFCPEDNIRDISGWKSICNNVGYHNTTAKQIYDELPAPHTDVFPFENEIMQWMGEWLCVSEK